MARRPVRPRPVGRRLRRHAKVFWSGRSQAVRLPMEFRFSTAEVVVRRDGQRVILEPLAIRRDRRGWPVSFWEIAGAAPTFDVGERRMRHERTDPFARRR